MNINSIEYLKWKVLVYETHVREAGATQVILFIGIQIDETKDQHSRLMESGFIFYQVIFLVPEKNVEED